MLWAHLSALSGHPLSRLHLLSFQQRCFQGPCRLSGVYKIYSWDWNWPESESGRQGRQSLALGAQLEDGQSYMGGRSQTVGAGEGLETIVSTSHLPHQQLHPFHFYTAWLVASLKWLCPLPASLPSGSLTQIPFQTGCTTHTTLSSLSESVQLKCPQKHRLTVPPSGTASNGSKLMASSYSGMRLQVLIWPGGSPPLGLSLSPQLPVLFPLLFSVATTQLWPGSPCFPPPQRPVSQDQQP